MKSFLRTIVAASLCVTSLSTIQAQTIFTYGNKSVSKDEFPRHSIRIMRKPRLAIRHTAITSISIPGFKIKVQAALDARLDTLSTQQNELAAFRGQVVESYMNDEASVNILRDEAIQRAGKDIHVAHIFIAAGANATAEQAKQAQQKIQAAYARLQAGDDFTKTALAYSEDPAVHTNKGDLGYITVFVLPYEMETLVYNTPVGKFTSPYRSKNGYHLFKVLNDRKALGRMKVAQILLSFVPEATDAQQQEVARKADSLYNALLKGSDFKQLAAAFSNDNLTYQTGGEMMAFGVGRYSTRPSNRLLSHSKKMEISLSPSSPNMVTTSSSACKELPIPADKAGSNTSTK